MKASYALNLATISLTRSKLRTWLTITGIVIGVAAVILIVSIGNGLQANVQAQLGGLGADIVTVSPGFNRAASGLGGFRGGGGFGGVGDRGESANLTETDLTAAKLTPGVKIATGILSSRSAVGYNGDNANANVKGVDPLAYSQITPQATAAGRILTGADQYSVVVGYRVANQVFKRPITVNSVISIAGKSFRVVGILAQSSGFGGDDNSILMPIAQARSTLTGFTPTQFSSISIKVADVNNLDQNVADLTQRLSNSRHVTPANQDFTVTATQNIRNSIASVTSSISLFLGGIAAISLLVGAIGIANTMFMAVVERTRQIGIYKALGATQGEISRMFLIESAILGLTGGAIGIAISVLIGLAADSLGVGLSLPTGGGPGSRAPSAFLITPELIAFAIVFSAVIGMAAGYFPAKQAAKLNPVEALRYE